MTFSGTFVTFVSGKGKATICMGQEYPLNLGLNYGLIS